MFGRVAVLCLVTLLPLSAVAQKAPAGNAKQTFVFNDEGLRDTVTFVLDAPLEMIRADVTELLQELTEHGLVHPRQTETPSVEPGARHHAQAGGGERVGLA